MTEITQDVIVDLLPVYFSEEASEQTRRMVETYFAEHPDFEKMARRMHAKMLDAVPVQLAPNHEAKTFRRMKIGLAWVAVVVVALMALSAFAAVAIMFLVPGGG